MLTGKLTRVHRPRLRVTSISHADDVTVEEVDEEVERQWRSKWGRVQWRVIYRVVPDDLTYYIESVTPHAYRRP